MRESVQVWDLKGNKCSVQTQMNSLNLDECLFRGQLSVFHAKLQSEGLMLRGKSSRPF